MAINYTFSSQLTAWDSTGYGASGRPSPWCTSEFVRISSQGDTSVYGNTFGAFDVILPLSNFNPGPIKLMNRNCYVYATSASPIAMVYQTQTDGSYLFILSAPTHNFDTDFNNNINKILYSGEVGYSVFAEPANSTYGRSIYLGMPIGDLGEAHCNTVALMPLTAYPTVWEQQHRTMIYNNYLSTFCPGARLDRAVLSAQQLPKTLNTIVANAYDSAPATNLVVLSSTWLTLGTDGDYIPLSAGNIAITYTTLPNAYDALPNGPVLLLKTLELSSGELEYTGTNMNAALFKLERKQIAGWWIWKLHVPLSKLTDTAYVDDIVYYKIIGTVDVPTGNSFNIPFKLDAGVQVTNNQAYVPGWQADPHNAYTYNFFVASLSAIRILSPAQAGYIDAIATTRTLSEQIRVRAALG